MLWIRAFITTVLLATATSPCSSFSLSFHNSIRQQQYYRRQRHGSSLFSHSSMSTEAAATAAVATTTPIRIFCYGDSLTAGTCPAFDTQLFPYGPHLEKALNDSYLHVDDGNHRRNNDEEQRRVMVRWKGLPGWTASAMVEYLDDPDIGLRSILNRIRDPSLSLVIILAGTNDIGALTSVSSSSLEDASLAVEPILQLHRACLDWQDHDGIKNVHTLAVGIPESGWQKRNAKAAKLCFEINQALQKFASSEERMSYVDFPFGYSSETTGNGDGGNDGDDDADGGSGGGDSSAYWSSDGLHFSPQGYATLGKALAPCVKAILNDESKN